MFNNRENVEKDMPKIIKYMLENYYEYINIESTRLNSNFLNIHIYSNCLYKIVKECHNICRKINISDYYPDLFYKLVKRAKININKNINKILYNEVKYPKEISKIIYEYLY
jgi:hypothetical protein